MLISIEHQEKSTPARTGTLHLPHGDISTPAFMPVGTAATVKGMYPSEVADLGYKLILANTYHLLLRPGIETVHSLGGIRGFSSWPYNILTDSGGYQVFSLPGLRRIEEEGVYFRSHIDGNPHTLTPESVVLAQANLGSDIQMVLDVCTPPDITRQKAQEAMDQTTRWLQRAKAQWQSIGDWYHGHLFGIIQGNFFPELRKAHAITISEMDTPGIAIGGLSVGESRAQFEDILAHTAQFLPEEKPRYVMGIGTPDFILSAVSAGIDMFDCVLPTRVARNGSIFTRNGLVSLKRAIHRGSDLEIDPIGGTAPQLASYSRGYLHHLFNAKEMLGPMIATKHNLFFMQTFMQEIRDSIREDRFPQYAAGFMQQFQSGINLS